MYVFLITFRKCIEDHDKLPKYYLVLFHLTHWDMEIRDNDIPTHQGFLHKQVKIWILQGYEELCLAHLNHRVLLLHV